MVMRVFVHGVPETAVIWDKVRARVGGDSVALAMPGFGCPRPDGFGATRDEYVDWLVGELDAIGEPVDLVGHDWGAILTYRVAHAFGDRLHSWAADVGNTVHPDYVWHQFAQIWQSDQGEEFTAAQLAMPLEERAAGLSATRMLSEQDALELAGGVDEVMNQCILNLYRSAVPNPHLGWGPWSPTPAPGLVIHPTLDPFSDATLAGEVAAQLGAGFVELPDSGHFWPYQSPDAGAALLTQLWAGLG